VTIIRAVGGHLAEPVVLRRFETLIDTEYERVNALACACGDLRPGPSIMATST
jgi:hypothetical protein